VIENNLYNAVKDRFFAEINASLQRHPRYAGDVRAYGKYNTAQERPQLGVRLESVSGSRLHLSPDDSIGDFLSIVTMAKVGNHPGTSIEWVWEDVYNLSKTVTDEEITLFQDATRSSFVVANTPMTAGPQNPDLATNRGHVIVKINGVPIPAKNVDAKSGTVTMLGSIPFGAQVQVSYTYRDIDHPGYYFIEMTSETEFLITPMLTEDGEIILSSTTGTETEVHLAKSPVLIDYVLNIYIQRSSLTHKIYLDRKVDYDIDVDGTVRLLQPLPRGYTLYASYRWQGPTRGPFQVLPEYSYVDKAIKGVVLAFGSRKQAGDKHCVILTETRERVANVKGGHYLMNMEWRVHARDPQTASEIADHLTADIWGNRKEAMRSEGVTIQEFMASSESESVYDDATQAMFFENSITAEVMTEWKKFIPYVLKVRRYNANVQMVSPEQQEALVRLINPILRQELSPVKDSVLVQHPKLAYPLFY